MGYQKLTQHCHHHYRHHQHHHNHQHHHRQYHHHHHHHHHHRQPCHFNITTVNLSSIKPPGGAYFFQVLLRGGGGLIEREGLNERGGLFNLAKRITCSKNTVVTERVDLRFVDYLSHCQKYLIHLLEPKTNKNKILILQKCAFRFI